jgi:hypothetical protein
MLPYVAQFRVTRPLLPEKNYVCLEIFEFLTETVFGDVLV